MDRYYFFEDDWEDLQNEIKHISQNRKEAQDKMIKALVNRKDGLVTDVMYNAMLAIYEVFDKYLNELNHIRDHGKVVRSFPPEEGIKTVSMGTIVVVRNITDDRDMTLDIRGYWVADNDNGRVAYDAFLPRLLMGAVVGETRRRFIEGVEKKYKIKEIR